MILYTSGTWSLSILFRLRGSVFPKAIAWAAPAAGIAAFNYWLLFDVVEFPGVKQSSAVGTMWASFTFILGFLVVFRTQQAYSRYWEGATLVQQARANFFNACSSVIAFSSKERQQRSSVEEFQHLLVRLTSMLHCVGLQTVAEERDVKFEFFNTDGIEIPCLSFLTSKTDKHQRCEIVIQWIQRLVIDGLREGILDVPAPILTRFFAELSQGAVHIINARNMTGIPFPFPYAQMLTGLLVSYWLLAPFLSAILLQSSGLSALLTFISVFAFWGTNYIAAEIESPFGDDPNDLPLHALQKDMNKSLWILLEPRTQSVPKFEFDKSKHRKWDVICQTNFSKVGEESKALFHGVGGTKSWLHKGRDGRTTESFADDGVPRLPTRQSVFSEDPSHQLSDPNDSGIDTTIFPGSPCSRRPGTPNNIGSEDSVFPLPRTLVEEEESASHKLRALPHRQEWSKLTDPMQVFDRCIHRWNELLEQHLARTLQELHTHETPKEFNRHIVQLGLELETPRPSPQLDFNRSQIESQIHMSAHDHVSSRTPTQHCTGSAGKSHPQSPS